ncbi:MAG: hypothetical protein IH931_02750 [candidate division Zixibacteria bacterium]|nr:hypothetical protein [candidate division Zixibacteria bacterium]
MYSQSWARILLVLFITVIGFGCGIQKVLTENDNIPAGFVDADGTNETLTPDTLRNPFPHLLMTDGRITLNDRCPVRKAILNKRLPALFVNSRPLGFC